MAKAKTKAPGSKPGFTHDRDDTYIVVRRGVDGWNVVQVQPKAGRLLASLVVVVSSRAEAWSVARQGAANFGIPLLEGAR